ncbi:hypothetical protein WUBG_18286, partial [Wuchereria bancrofti]
AKQKLTGNPSGVRCQRSLNCLGKFLIEIADSHGNAQDAIQCFNDQLFGIRQGVKWNLM